MRRIMNAINKFFSSPRSTRELSDIEKVKLVLSGESLVRKDGDFLVIGDSKFSTFGITNYKIDVKHVLINFGNQKVKHIEFKYKGFTYSELSVDRKEFVKQLAMCLDEAIIRERKESYFRTKGTIPLTVIEKVKENARLAKLRKEAEAEEARQFETLTEKRAAEFREYVMNLYMNKFIPRLGEDELLHIADSCFAANTISGWGSLGQHEYLIYIVAAPVTITMEIKESAGELYDTFAKSKRGFYSTSFSEGDIKNTTLKKARLSPYLDVGYVDVFDTSEKKALMLKRIADVLNKIVTDNRNNGLMTTNNEETL